MPDDTPFQPPDGQTDELFRLVYDELRRLAGAYMARERRNHTLQPTALVHDAYVRLAKQVTFPWQDRAHFIGVAARAMRQVLVDHARSRGAVKRGGDLQRVTLDEALGLAVEPDVDLLGLDDAMRKLAAIDPRAAQVTELRVFAGCTVGEVAEALAVSERTVDKDWAMARMWLSRELRAGE